VPRAVGARDGVAVGLRLAAPGEELGRRRQQPRCSLPLLCSVRCSSARAWLRAGSARASVRRRPCACETARCAGLRARLRRAIAAHVFGQDGADQSAWLLRASRRPLGLWPAQLPAAVGQALPAAGWQARRAAESARAAQEAIAGLARVGRQERRRGRGARDRAVGSRRCQLASWLVWLACAVHAVIPRPRSSTRHV
jgi:hypothetical protein